MTDISGQVALVTGANRGMGRHFVMQLLERGAVKVYAAARDVSTIDDVDARIVPIQLDITDQASVRRAARAAPDVNIVINNAGIEVGASPLDADQSEMRREFETNYFGPLSVASFFVDHLVANGGVLLNVHSVLSWVSAGTGSYAATKSALWSATNTIRLELAPRGVHVVGLHVGLIDTEMGRKFEGDKSLPQEVVAAALDGIESGVFEVLADDASRQVKAGLSAPIEAMYPQLAHPASSEGAALTP